MRARHLALAATMLVAAPAQANPDRERAFMEARIAADAGADERASRQYTSLLAAEPANQLIAGRALDHGLLSGDYRLALAAARRLDAAGALPPVRRLLLVADALRTRDWAAVEREAARMAGDQIVVLMAPALRAWRAFGAGEANPAVQLAPMASGPVSTYAAEHIALLELAAGRGDGGLFLALSPDAGLRPQHLRLLAAAEFQHRGDRAKALALAAGDQPAMAAARRMIETGRPIPGRIDSAAEGFAEFLARVAIDFDQQQVAHEGLIFARLASWLAPEAAQPLMIASELADDNDPAAAARLLEAVPEQSPFASTARDIRIALLSRAGRSAAAFTEVSARTSRGSREVRDWVQLGQLHDEAARHVEAARAYARARELWTASPDPALAEWSLVLARAGALDQSGNWPEARAALIEAHRLAPTEPLVLNYLGYARIDRGEALDESEAMIREAVRLAPGNAAIVDSLGWALFKRGRVAEAIPLLESAARGEPADIEINEHLGDAYYSAGRRIEARFAWNAAVIHAENEVAERLRRKIDRGLPRARWSVMRETAYAKLNLALHVRAREPDGYHRIETIFAFCEDGDELTVEPGQGLTLAVSGRFGEGLKGPDNLVLRAAEALRANYGVTDGAHLHLDKILPVAAGVGGGSADAAAALRLLVRWWRLPGEPEILHAIARQLGADVPACLASRTVRGEGRGDTLKPVARDFGRPMRVLLVNPGVAMPTGPVFAGWNGVDHGPLGDELIGRNDLLDPARRIAPVIDEVLAALSLGASCGMSGSGATCFALFRDAATREEAGEQIAAAHLDWWTLQTCLR